MRTFREYMNEMTVEEIQEDLLTIEHIKDELTDNYLFAFKFIKISDEYKFLDFMENHIDAVSDDELPLVDGAGTIVAYENSWKVEDAYSMTISRRMKELGLDPSKAAMNKENYEYFTEQFGDQK